MAACPEIVKGQTGPLDVSVADNRVTWLRRAIEPQIASFVREMRAIPPIRQLPMHEST